MGKNIFQNIAKAQMDAVKSVKEGTEKAAKAIVSVVEKIPNPDPTPAQTPPEAAGSGMGTVEAPAYATPTAINRADAKAVASQAPSYATPTAINRADTQATMPKPPVLPKVEVPSYATPTAINRVDKQVAPRIGTGLRDLQARIGGHDLEDAYQAAEDAAIWGPRWMSAGQDQLEKLYADFETDPTLENALVHDHWAETYQQEFDAYRSLVEQYMRQHSTKGLQPVLDQVKGEYDAAVKKNSATASPQSGVQFGITQQDPIALFNQLHPGYQAAVQEKKAAQTEEDEAFQRYRLWLDRYNAAVGQESKARREEELLAEVSTPEWDRRIRDMYATPDQFGRVSEEEVYSQKIKAAKGMAVVERDKAKARLDTAEEKLMEATSNDMFNAIDQSPEYLAASEEYWAAKEEYDEWNLRVIELSNMDYPARNRSAMTRMKADPEAGRTYVDAKTALEDKDKLKEILDVYRRGGPTSQKETDRVNLLAEELERKYGLEHATIIAYAGNMPAKPGAVSVEDVYASIDALVQSGAEALGAGQRKDGGSYDFNDLYDYERRLHSQAMAATAAKKQQEYAREHPEAATVGSVVSTPFRVLDLSEIDWGRGNPGEVGYVPPDTSGMTVSNFIDTTRGTISGDLELRYGKAAAFLYNTGLGMADSAVAVGLFGGGSIYVMGTNAAISGAKDIIDRGGTSRQAFLGGLAAGVAETLFEKISVDRLLGLDLENVQSVAGAILGQAATEAGEETLTEITNILFDAVIMGKNSNSARALEAYMDQGMSREQAQRQVFWDNVGQVALAGAGGALSGGFMSGGKLAVDYVSQQLGAYRSAASSVVNTVSALPKMTMADFTDVNSPVWRNVDYEDVDTQSQITLETHQQMVRDGQVVQVTEETLQKVGKYFPDVRSKPRAEKNAILSSLKTAFKAALREFLGGLQGTSYGLEVNGYILEATLYDRGIKEVVEKLTRDKGSMLYHSEDIFKGARYLYSTPGYDGDTNIYRWNYFYTPVQIGQDILGVRIAVRDMKQTIYNTQESQIYHWGIKRDASLDGKGPGQSPLSLGVSSDAPGSVSLDGEQPGISASSLDVSSDTSSTMRIHQLLQKVKAEAREGLEKPYGASEETWAKLKSSLADPILADKMRKALGDYLGYSPEFQKTIAPLLDKTLAAMEDVVLWEGLDRSSQTWQDLQPLYQERKETVQWLENILQKMEGLNEPQGEKAEELPQQDTERFTEAKDHDKMISGALNPESSEAGEHAERYYEEVRHMSTDVAKIAQATGIAEAEIQAVKEFLFLEEHDLGGKLQRFYPDFMIAQSWQRLAAGTPEPHDLTLLHHEIMERDLMRMGYTQAEAHEMTSKVYNYKKEAIAFYGQIKKYKEN